MAAQIRPLPVAVRGEDALAGQALGHAELLLYAIGRGRHVDAGQPGAVRADPYLAIARLDEGAHELAIQAGHTRGREPDQTIEEAWTILGTDPEIPARILGQCLRDRARDTQVVVTVHQRYDWWPPPAFPVRATRRGKARARVGRSTRGRRACPCSRHGRYGTFAVGVLRARDSRMAQRAADGRAAATVGRWSVVVSTSRVRTACSRD